MLEGKGKTENKKKLASRRKNARKRFSRAVCRNTNINKVLLGEILEIVFYVGRKRKEKKIHICILHFIGIILEYLSISPITELFRDKLSPLFWNN
jgi:hypothetical protein